MNIDDDLLDRLRRDGALDTLLGDVRHLLVGCSGGGDSLCLLDVLARLSGQRPLRLTVAHLNHGLRGEQSDAEEARVARAAAQYDLPLALHKADLSGPAGDLEARCRRVRHDFFRRLCEQQGADGVALAHTLDDRVETVLMNLARGAGRRGLAGMRARSCVGGLLLLRPLLGMRRQELREHLRRRGIEWHEDPMNEDPRFTRVRLRQEVLPALSAAVPAAVQNIARAAAILEQEEQWIGELVDERLGSLLLPETRPGIVALDAAALRRLHPALQARVLRAAIGKVRGELQEISQEHVEAVMQQVLGGVERARDLPGVRAMLQGGALHLLPLHGRVLLRPSGWKIDR